jgi:glutathione S-transferase
MARQTRKIEGGLREVARLVPPGGYCVGDRFGLGDIAVGSMLGFLHVRFPELDWSSAYPHLADLYAWLSERPSFVATAPVPQRIAAGVV